MHRRTAVIDDKAFAAIDAMLDDGFCLCAIVTDGDGRPVDYKFLRVSRNFEAMTGLAGAEGRTVLELAPGMDRSWIETFGRVALDRQSVRVTQGRRTGESERVFEVFAAPIDPPGCFAMTFRDVSALRRAEAERERALEAAQGLLRELNHRVMNSFAAISAIAALETRAAPPEARDALRRLQGRVQALGALYRRLDGATRVDSIEASDYLGGNVEAFAASVAAEAEVAIEARIETLTLPVKAAVPLGLVLNELLTEAVRRAARSGRPGTIRVTLAAEAGELRLRVADDLGPVADDEPGAGPSLVATFAGELAARVGTEATAAGTTVAVTFPRPA